MTYRHEATSVAGFVQQLAVAYIAHGYWWYVTGVVPKNKDPTKIDAKLMDKYDVRLSRWTRARRKKQGLASVHYLRFGRFYVLIATRGEHVFRIEEADQVADVRRKPIVFAGYSIGYKPGVDRKGHASVRIHAPVYNDLKAYLLDVAPKRRTAQLETVFWRLPYEPYAPVRRQHLNLLRAVNRVRKRAGLPVLGHEVLRLRRQVVRPFEPVAHTEID